MFVSVVTFSEQIDLILDVMDHIVGQGNNNRTLTIDIPTKGSEMCSEGGSQFGKQKHMALARHVLMKQHPNVAMSSEKTLLIDDSWNNAWQATSRGTSAILFDPDHPGRLWKDLLEITVSRDGTKNPNKPTIH